MNALSGSVNIWDLYGPGHRLRARRERYNRPKGLAHPLKRLASERTRTHIQRRLIDRLKAQEGEYRRDR